MKRWEIIADNLHDAGWSLGWVSAVDSEGRTIWIADAHRDNGKRFVVHACETLTAFLKPNLLRLVATFVRDFASLVSDSRNLEGDLWSGAGN